MSNWNFDAESNHPALGANSVAGILAGNQPMVEADVLASKRNVIATERGWVRREVRGDGPTPRIIDEVLVAANPGSGLSYTSNSYLFTSDIAQIYVKPNANGVITVDAVSNVYVTFNTPLVFAGAASGNNLTLTVANTVSGNHQVATCVSGIANTIVNANNTLVFQFTPGVIGTYQVNAQSISVVGGGNPLYNPDQDTTHTANLVITGAVSNTLSTFTVGAQS